MPWAPPSALFELEGGNGRKRYVMAMPYFVNDGIAPDPEAMALMRMQTNNQLDDTNYRVIGGKPVVIDAGDTEKDDLGFCERPTAFDRYGRSTATCRAPAVVFRPNHLVRLLCAACAVPNAGPMPGLFIKYLHVDPVIGFYTRLVHAQEGWADHRLAHHPCYEEAYTTQGHMEYNFGTLDLGTYFFRPARVKHGHFTTMEGGATWLLRSDGELVNWYTQNEWVRWGGEAVNYAPGGGRGRWDGDGM